MARLDRTDRSDVSDRAATGRLAALSPRRPDLWLILIAILFAVPSLTYPFGRDQAAFAYIGRWWLDGILPYHGSFDIKPPGVFILHAASAALFGFRQFGIRIFDLAGILLMTWLVLKAVRRDTPAAPGEAGALVLIAAGFYYTTFDYWDTAQTELWQGLALLGGYTALVRIRGVRRAAIVSGLLAGVAVIFKLTAGVVCVGLAIILLHRAMRPPGSARDGGVSASRGFGSALGVVCLQAGAAVAVVGAVVLYFAANRALGPLREALLDFARAYGTSWRTPADTALDWSRYFWTRTAQPWAAVAILSWIAAVYVAVRRRGRGAGGEGMRDLAGPAETGVLLVSSVAAVVAQGKFFPYHWGITAPFLLLCLAYGLRHVSRLSAPWIPSAVGLSVWAAGFLLAPPWSSNLAAGSPDPTNYRRFTLSAWSHLLGIRDRAAFLTDFTGGYGFVYADQERLADVIRKHMRPGDTMLVHGFEPCVYTRTGLRAPTRFFIGTALDEDRVDFDAGRWRDERAAAIRANPPRFVVTFIDSSGDVRRLEAGGYRRLARSGRLLALMR